MKKDFDKQSLFLVAVSIRKFHRQKKKCFHGKIIAGYKWNYLKKKSLKTKKIVIDFNISVLAGITLWQKSRLKNAGSKANCFFVILFGAFVYDAFELKRRFLEQGSKNVDILYTNFCPQVTNATIIQFNNGEQIPRQKRKIPKNHLFVKYIAFIVFNNNIPS